MPHSLTSPFQQHLRVAEAAAREAGQALMESQGQVAVYEKGKSNLVTDADLASEALIVERIQAAFPDHGMIREEGASRGSLDDASVWVIDPLDATNNFAHGVPHYCVSIAYVEHGRVQVGVVFDPNRQELFSAVRGWGAWLNGEPMSISARKDLGESLIVTGFYYDRGALMEHTLESVKRLFHQGIHGIRRTGSAAMDLAWVACGRFDGFFEYQLAPWDYAAGWLLVEEAGGCVADEQAHPLVLRFTGGVVASNGQIGEALCQVVKLTEVERSHLLGAIG